MNNKWFGQLIQAVGAGPSLSNSSAETSILPDYCKWVLEAAFFNRPGDELFLELAGRISNIVTTPGTLTLKVKFGSIAVWNSGAISLNIVAKTTVPWKLHVPLTCQAAGSGTAATLIGIGDFQSESIIGSPANSAGGNGSLLVPVGAPAVGSGFDSTAAQTLDVTATFSIANSGNLLQLHQGRIISPN